MKFIQEKGGFSIKFGEDDSEAEKNIIKSGIELLRNLIQLHYFHHLKIAKVFRIDEE